MILIGCPECKPPIMLEIYPEEMSGVYLKICQFCGHQFKFEKKNGFTEIAFKGREG